MEQAAEAGRGRCGANSARGFGNFLPGFQGLGCSPAWRQLHWEPPEIGQNFEMWLPNKRQSHLQLNLCQVPALGLLDTPVSLLLLNAQQNL